MAPSVGALAGVVPALRPRLRPTRARASTTCGRPCRRTVLPVARLSHSRHLPVQAQTAVTAAASAVTAATAVTAAAATRTVSPRARTAVVAHAAVADAAPAPASGKKLAFYFFLWYVFNIVFNLYNKSALNLFPYPWFMSTLQLACGVVWMCAMWLFRLQPLPKVPKSFLLAVIPVAFFHTVGHVSACCAFSQMSVSFTHIVKAAEPVLSVMLSWPLMGEVYSLPVYLSLLPIVAGCSLSAMKEVSLNMSGLSGAMLSNVGMVLRNIYSKKSLNNYVIDGINLYAIISIVALIGLAPVAYWVEGSKWAAGYAAATAKVGEMKFLQMLAAGGLFYHLYNQLAYQALEGIDPTTFSVGNTMKRVVVVVASVMFFKNPVSPLNWCGSALAIAGTFWYSQAKQAHSDQLKAAKASAADEQQ